MTPPTSQQRQTSHIITSSAMNHQLLPPVGTTVSTKTSLTDRIGIALSGLCAVHCLILPLILPFLGTLASFVHSEWTHLVLAVLIIPTVAFAAWRGYQHHGKSEVLWLLGIGALSVLVALVVGVQGAGEHTETAVTTLGSIFLITGHWQNYKHHALCLTDEPHAH